MIITGTWITRHRTNHTILIIRTVTYSLADLINVGSLARDQQITIGMMNNTIGAIRVAQGILIMQIKVTIPIIVILNTFDAIFNRGITRIVKCRRCRCRGIKVSHLLNPDACRWIVRRVDHHICSKCPAERAGH